VEVISEKLIELFQFLFTEILMAKVEILKHIDENFKAKLNFKFKVKTHLKICIIRKISNSFFMQSRLSFSEFH
jgi:hypothetical protein